MSLVTVRSITVTHFTNTVDNICREETLPLVAFIERLTAAPKLLVGALNESDRKKKKNDNRLWTACKYSSDIRDTDFALEVSCLGLDFDDGTDGQEGLTEEDEEKLFTWIEEKEYLHVAHTSFSSGFCVKGRRRWRVVLFFEQPVKPAEYKQFWLSFTAQLPVKPDGACKDVGRNFFYPQCPVEHKDLFVSFTDGHRFLRPGGGVFAGLNSVEVRAQHTLESIKTALKKEPELAFTAFNLGKAAAHRGESLDSAQKRIWAECRLALTQNEISKPIESWQDAEAKCYESVEEGFDAVEKDIEQHAAEAVATFKPKAKQLEKAALALTKAVKAIKKDLTHVYIHAQDVGQYTPHCIPTERASKALFDAYVHVNTSRPGDRTAAGNFVDAAEIQAQIDSGLAAGAKDPKYIFGRETWRTKLVVDSEGFPAACDVNAKLIFSQHPDVAGLLRWNVREAAPSIMSRPPWETHHEEFPVGLDTPDAYDAGRWLAGERILGRALGSLAIREAMFATARQNEYDPFQEWLEALKWDNVPRLDSWLVDYAGAEASRYATLVAKNFVLGAVARTLAPETSAVDTVLVLQGPENLGKSRLLAALAGAGYFADELSDIKNKDAQLLMARNVIVEIAELDKFMQYDAAEVKSFITARDVMIRAAYERTAQRVVRRAVLAATTNEDGFLKSVTGNRRFNTVRCTAKCDLIGLAGAREQLWAEAVVRFKNKETWWLTDEADIQEAKERQEEVRVKDEIEFDLAFLDLPKTKDMQEETAADSFGLVGGNRLVTLPGQFDENGMFLWVTLKQVCTHIGLDYTDLRIQARVTRALKQKDWGPSKLKKLQGKVLRVYPRGNSSNW